MKRTVVSLLTLIFLVLLLVGCDETTADGTAPTTTTTTTTIAAATIATTDTVATTDAAAPTASVTTQPSAAGSITREQAKEIALSHAGIKGTLVPSLEVEYDLEGNVAYYEIEFRTNTAEYDYKIDATTGAVLKAEKNGQNTLPTAAPTLTREQAKAAALAHAGLAETAVRELEIELDNRGNVAYYEVSFETATHEYDYEIDASTGAILKVEKELQD